MNPQVMATSDKVGETTKTGSQPVSTGGAANHVWVPTKTGGGRATAGGRRSSNRSGKPLCHAFNSHGACDKNKNECMYIHQCSLCLSDRHGEHICNRDAPAPNAGARKGVRRRGQKTKNKKGNGKGQSKSK